MTHNEHEAMGLFFHDGQRFYPRTPEFVWLPDTELETFVRVLYRDGVQILYPLSAFDYLVLSDPK